MRLVNDKHTLALRQQARFLPKPFRVCSGLLCRDRLREPASGWNLLERVIQAYLGVPVLDVFFLKVREAAMESAFHLIFDLITRRASVSSNNSPLHVGSSSDTHSARGGLWPRLPLSNRRSFSSFLSGTCRREGFRILLCPCHTETFVIASYGEISCGRIPFQLLQRLKRNQRLSRTSRCVKYYLVLSAADAVEESSGLLWAAMAVAAGESNSSSIRLPSHFGCFNFCVMSSSSNPVRSGL